MKIKRLKIKGYKIFDDIELDFTDNNGKALDLVVFAGVNGSGKTTIFELISKLFSESSNIFRLDKLISIDEFNSDFDSIMCKEIQVDIELEESSRHAMADLLSNFLMLSKNLETTNDDKVPNQISRVLQKFNKTSNDITLQYELKTIDDKVQIVKNDFLLFAILSSKNISSYAKIAYFLSSSWSTHKKLSKIAKKLTVNKVKSSSIESVDKYDVTEDGVVSSVDILEQSEDIGKYIVKSMFNKMLSNENLTVKESLAKSIEMLNSPLEEFSLYTKLIKIENDEPVFQSFNGQKLKLEDLSAGEKNLFYRSCYLNMMNLNNSILLVDEPENSLHPSWQQRILSLYKKSGKNNQVFIATHSPFIISSSSPENIILLSPEMETVKLRAFNMGKDCNQPTKGLDPNRVLVEVMALESLRPGEEQLRINNIFKKLQSVRQQVDINQPPEKEELNDIEESINYLSRQLGANDMEVVKLRHQLYVVNRLLSDK